MMKVLFQAAVISTRRVPSGHLQQGPGQFQEGGDGKQGKIISDEKYVSFSSQIGRSTSADYGLFLARARAGEGVASGRSQRSHTSQPDGRTRMRGGATPRPTPRHNQSHSHWAYFR